MGCFLKRAYDDAEQVDTTKNKKGWQTMKLKPWKLEDQIKTKLDLMEYLKAGLEEGNFHFALIVCRDFLEIAEKKGWTNAKNNH